MWDAFVAQQTNAHLLQLSAWGDLKAAFGWEVDRVVMEDGGHVVAGAQILFRRLPLSKMAYVAMGPYNASPDLWRQIDRTARKNGAAFLKWEPGIVTDFDPTGFRPSPQTIQPPRTILIDISGDDDTIMGRMNQGTRRKIRQSLKKGITYSEASREDVAKFNSIMQVTGDRKAFGVHAPEYYAMAYDLFVPDHAALILAEHEDDVLAGVMVFAVGNTAWYIAGASSHVKRNLMASYGVQWQAIQWARARGCTCYDMWGVPDEDAETLEAHFQERTEGLWGVYGFKRGWGGDVVRSAGAWDRVYNPVIYHAYRLALKARALL